MKKTATKWLAGFKQHASNCRCPDRTRAELTQVIKTLNVESHEQSTLMTMLRSKDKENHFVLISLLQEKAPYIFEPEPIKQWN